MIRRLLLPAAALAGVAGAPGLVQAAVAPKTLHVLTSEQVDPARLVPPPPKDGSDVQKGEMAEVLRLYKTTGPERMAQARWDDVHETAELFFATLGPQFDLAKLPATARSLAVVENEQSVVANMAKRYFLRNRPWAIDPSIRACDYKPNAAPLTSYPSGHATLGYSVGFILAQLMPEKAQPILARADEYARSRVICGAHYPSDVEASHVLATEMAMMMLRDGGFAAQFKAAHDELKTAGLTAS